MRFLSGRAATLRHTFYDDENAISGIPSVSVTVWPQGVSTPVINGVAASENSTTHEWSINAGKLPTGVYKVEWNSTNYTDTDEFEIVGNFIFTVAEARAADADIADATRFPASKITGFREQIENEFQRITWRSFTQRTTTLTFTYDPGYTAGYVPTDAILEGPLDMRAITAVKVNGVAGDLTQWAVTPDGLIEASVGVLSCGDKVCLTIDYGFSSPPPDVKRVAFLRLRNLLASERSGVPDRATSFVAENGGQFTLATAGMRGFETGIPDVDAVLKRYRFDILDSVM